MIVVGAERTELSTFLTSTEHLVFCSIVRTGVSEACVSFLKVGSLKQAKRSSSEAMRNLMVFVLACFIWLVAGVPVAL